MHSSAAWRDGGAGKKRTEECYRTRRRNEKQENSGMNYTWVQARKRRLPRREKRTTSSSRSALSESGAEFRSLLWSRIRDEGWRGTRGLEKAISGKRDLFSRQQKFNSVTQRKSEETCTRSHLLPLCVCVHLILLSAWGGGNEAGPDRETLD